MAQGNYVKRRVVMAGIAVVLAGVAGCTSQNPGSPAAGASTGGRQSTENPSSGVAPSNGSSGALPVNHPCTLLSSNDAQQLGASAPPSQDVTGGVQTCEVSLPNGNITIGFMANQGPVSARDNGTDNGYDDRQSSGQTDAQYVRQHGVLCGNRYYVVIEVGCISSD